MVINEFGMGRQMTQAEGVEALSVHVVNTHPHPTALGYNIPRGLDFPSARAPKILSSLLLLQTLFAFEPSTWPIWDAFCAQRPFISGHVIPIELKVLHERGVWSFPGEALPTPVAAEIACENYQRYRQL